MNIKQILNTAVGGYSLSKILSALVTLLVCLIAVRLIMKVVTRLLSRMQKVNERLQKVILTSLKTLLYLLTIIITAEALGINTSSLTAIMSVLTLGVTLAAEDILGNVAGGLVILFSHPFSLGDEIEVGGTTPDGLFSLDSLRCVGACGLAPVVMIGPRVYGRLKVTDVKGILDEIQALEKEI